MYIILFAKRAISMDLETEIRYCPPIFKFNKKQKRIKILSIFLFSAKMRMVNNIDIKKTIK